LCFEAVQVLDVELAGVARSSGSLRFALGLGLDALARMGGHHDLGFSSLDAYARERCWCSSSCAREARGLARRAVKLPLLCEALRSDQVSWSMALEIAKVAKPEGEAAWLARGGGCTVAAMRDLVRAELGAGADDAASDGEAQCTLTVTANVEDIWLFECVRLLVQQMDGGTTNDVVDALVGEATTSLFELLPREVFASEELAPSSDAQNAWNRQLAAWRAEGERLCESRIPRWSPGEATAAGDAVPFDFTGSPASIDAALRRISAALEERETRIGELAERFWAADGWRRLGYGTDAQYARERLGMGISSVKDKKLLVRRLKRLPHLAKALREHAVCYEAALTVSRIATPETDAAWAQRAIERTVVQLREDVCAAKHLARVDQCSAIEPPEPDTVTAWLALRSCVITGAVFDDRGASRISDDPLGGLREAFASARSTPPHLFSKGRETLRLRVAPEIRALYRGVERLYLRHRPAGMTFLRFACLSVIEQWAHARPSYEYAHIYLRDGMRCTNPVCNRRDVTPHHIKYRAHGGGDEGTNLSSLCVWCHLRGEHEGRLRVTGKAPGSLTWWVGGHTMVEGRTRRAA
jgi:hypothetical protein